jgi:hypothetical protein
MNASHIIIIIKSGWKPMKKRSKNTKNKAFRREADRRRKTKALERENLISFLDASSTIAPPRTKKQTKSEKQRKSRRKRTNLRWCSRTLARVVVAPAAFIFNAILRGSTFLPFRSGCTFSLLNSHSMRVPTH